MIIGEREDFRSFAAFGGTGRDATFFAAVKEPSIMECTLRLRHELRGLLPFAEKSLYGSERIVSSR